MLTGFQIITNVAVQFIILLYLIDNNTGQYEHLY